MYYNKKKSFKHAENSLRDALDNLIPYYTKKHLRPNPEKTQLCDFHLRYREANRQLRVAWYGKNLQHVRNPIYLGVSLDRSLTCKEHSLKINAKVESRNNIKTLTNTRWGADAKTIRTTALALTFSDAEYASPVWCRSTHASKVAPALSTCRAINGCLKPTNVYNLYLLSGVAPPYIRRTVASQHEKLKQKTDPRHLCNHAIPNKRLKSRRSFLHCVNALDTNFTAGDYPCCRNTSQKKQTS